MKLKNRNLTWAVLCPVLYILAAACLVPLVYGIIDDRSMMEIVSGQYLGRVDAHTIFTGYWYSLFLTGLYSLVPNIDWYAFAYLLLQGTCMGLMIYRVSGKKEGRKKACSMIMVILFFTVLGLQAMTQLTFTTTAAVLGVTVIFWYLTTAHFHLSDWLILFLLCFLTEQVRPSIFFMIVPVCGVLWLFRLLRPEGREKWHLLVPLAVLGTLLLSAAGKQIGYGSEAWQTYEIYNENRSEVYDYADHALPLYDEAEAFYNSIGIEKKGRARTLLNYNYTADDRITPDFFSEYLAAYDQAFPSGQSRITRIRQSVKEYLKDVAGGKFHWIHAAALVLYVLLAVRYLYRRRWTDCLKVLCTAGIQGLLWIYLIYEGRIPDRVIYSMNLMLTVTALLLWLEAFSWEKPSGKPEKILLAAMMLLLCLGSGWKIREIRQQNLEISYKNEDIDALKTYCMEHPDNFYFNDVTSLAFTTYNVKLWRTETAFMNYMSLGDWMSYSPIWQEKLNEEGISSVREALYESENVYLICSFDKGLEYLVSLYENVTCTEVDKVRGFYIYKLSVY